MVPPAPLLSSRGNVAPNRSRIVPCHRLCAQQPTPGALVLTVPYRHGLLDPRPHSAAQQLNAALLGPYTLGVEVTEPVLAARCGLGNIDPQHRPGGGAIAAIEAAMDWPLPPPETCLVTIRPDADAFGAMAVLSLRASGLPFTPPIRARIAQIARADCFANGIWPGPRSLPARTDDIDEAGPGEQNLGALIGGLGDRALPVCRAVTATRDWIVSGVVPAEWHERAARAAKVLFAALQSGQVRVVAAGDGGIAIVEGCVPGALRLGYRLAPVVVAVDGSAGGDPPAPWRRMTVAQWQAGHVDLMRAAALLGCDEPGWGGAPGIIGSPQGKSCHRTVSAVLAVLHACRTP